MGDFAKRIAERNKGLKKHEAVEDVEEQDDDLEPEDLADEGDGEDEEDDTPPPKKTAAKRPPAPVEDDEDADEEDDAPPPPKKAAVKKAPVKPAAEVEPAVKKGLPEGVRAHVTIASGDEGYEGFYLKVPAPEFTHDFIRRLLEAAKG